MTPIFQKTQKKNLAGKKIGNGLAGVHRIRAPIFFFRVYLKKNGVDIGSLMGDMLKPARSPPPPSITEKTRLSANPLGASVRDGKHLHLYLFLPLRQTINLPI